MTDDGCIVNEKQILLNQRPIEGGRLVFKHHEMTRAGVTQETCDAASKCLNRNNGDPDDRADKIQLFEGMVRVTITVTVQVLAMRLY